MKFYKFSPIKSKEELFEAIKHIHFEAHKLCNQTFGKYLEKDGIPETTYTHLYIRRPDPYRHHVGDVDFYLEAKEYEELKKSLLSGEKLQDARVFERPDLDMIELYNPDSDVLAYVSTKMMTEKVRVKLSDATKL